MRIEEAIQQKSFINDHQKAYINLLYTSHFLTYQNNELLKPFQLSTQQFNVLRILRGMHPEPATIKILTERMIDKMSNASRLVEKLRQKELVERKECPEDRRRVDVVITKKGLKVLEKASNVIEQRFNKEKSPLSKEEAKMLNLLLDKIRG